MVRSTSSSSSRESSYQRFGLLAFASSVGVALCVSAAVTLAGSTSFYGQTDSHSMNLLNNTSSNFSLAGITYSFSLLGALAGQLRHLTYADSSNGTHPAICGIPLSRIMDYFVYFTAYGFFMFGSCLTTWSLLEMLIAALHPLSSVGVYLIAYTGFAIYAPLTLALFRSLFRAVLFQSDPDGRGTESNETMADRHAITSILTQLLASQQLSMFQKMVPSRWHVASQLDADLQQKLVASQAQLLTRQLSLVTSQLHLLALQKDPASQESQMTQQEVLSSQKDVITSTGDVLKCFLDVLESQHHMVEGVRNEADEPSPLALPSSPHESPISPLESLPGSHAQRSDTEHADPGRSSPSLINHIAIDVNESLLLGAEWLHRRSRRTYRKLNIHLYHRRHCPIVIGI